MRILLPCSPVENVQREENYNNIPSDMKHEGSEDDNNDEDSKYQINVEDG